MNRGLLKLSFACALTVAGVAPGFSRAECTCPPKPEMKAALESASVCFVGRVERIKESPLKKGYKEVRFAVLRHVKTMEELSRNTIVILTPNSADSCGFSFERGQDYIVYATGSPAGLKTDACSRTNYLDSALDEVNQLIALAKSR